jgi:membrane protein DedA with SNARE-associated domain
MTNPFGDLAGWVTDVIERLGYVGIAVLVALENVFPPIPSEVILPLAGFLAGQGRFWLPAAVLAATLGSLAGALVLYAVGHYFGEDRIRRLVRRYGKWFTVSERDLDRAEGWFDRHGGAVVFFGRLVPIIRSLVSIPAGVRRMPLGRFLLYTALGSTLWNGALIGAGWLLGDNWEAAGPYVEALQYVVIAAVAAAVVWFLFRRVIGNGRQRARSS